MGESHRVEFDLDYGNHCELCKEAERLGVTPEEMARRAVCDWLRDLYDEEPGRRGA